MDMDEQKSRRPWWGARIESVVYYLDLVITHIFCNELLSCEECTIFSSRINLIEVGVCIDR